MKPILHAFATLFLIFFIVACGVTDTDETEFRPLFDCPEIGKFVGDSCTVADSTLMVGVVDTNCRCLVPVDVTVDCPALDANVGDSCVSATGTAGLVDNACNCTESGQFECPRLMGNVGDSCVVTGFSRAGVIDDNCECDVNDVREFDCPDQRAFFGERCFTLDPAGVDSIAGRYNQDCECEVAEQVDCPELGLDVGRTCFEVVVDSTTTTTTMDTLFGVVTGVCDCDLDNPYECPLLEGNVGDRCVRADGSDGTITATCGCE